MAIRKFAQVETPSDRALKHKIKMSKQHRSPIDRTSNYHDELCELARSHGRDPAAVIEEWGERAAAREYLGEFSRDEAEMLAFNDVAESLA